MHSIFRFIFVFTIAVNSSLTAQSFKRFIPKGFVLLDSASGDLNKDGHKDLIMILKSSLEETKPESLRPLLILHGTKDKTYTLAAKNEHVVYCSSCGGVFGDPYDDMVVKNNYFSVQHYGGSNWRWTRIITFKYDLKTKTYVLHKDGGESFHTNEPEKTTITFYNKKEYDKLLFINYSNESE